MFSVMQLSENSFSLVELTKTNLFLRPPRQFYCFEGEKKLTLILFFGLWLGASNKHKQNSQIFRDILETTFAEAVQQLQPSQILGFTPAVMSGFSGNEVWRDACYSRASIKLFLGGFQMRLLLVGGALNSCVTPELFLVLQVLNELFYKNTVVLI